MKLALAGDTMLGRKVAERLAHVRPEDVFAPEVVAITRDADLCILNLECAISDRGERWPDPHKSFFFRAPSSAVEVLRHLGVSAVTMANNHALDYGPDALLDTIDHLHAAGIATVGAGVDDVAAHTPLVLAAGGMRVGDIGITDHPSDFAAGPDRPGVAYADLHDGPPRWLLDTIAALDTEIVLVTPHWGPNMIDSPLPYVRDAARAFQAYGATVVAGHSAHVFHGVSGNVLYDLGDFIDDYASDPDLRNDLGLLFILTFEGRSLERLEAVPLALDYCHTRLADPGEAAWIVARFRRACSAFGTDVTERDGRLVIEWHTTSLPNRSGTAA